MNDVTYPTLDAWLQRYPEYENLRSTLTDLFYRFDDPRMWDCPPGWVKLIINAWYALELLQIRYRIDQVKEKFGALRLYAEILDEDPDPSRRFAFDAIIHYAEVKYASTCETCGETGRKYDVAMRDFSGWYHTYCDPCALANLQKTMTYMADKPYMHSRVKEAKQLIGLIEQSIERRDEARARRAKDTDASH